MVSRSGLDGKAASALSQTTGGAEPDAKTGGPTLIACSPKIASSKTVSSNPARDSRSMALSKYRALSSDRRGQVPPYLRSLFIVERGQGGTAREGEFRVIAAPGHMVGLEWRKADNFPRLLIDLREGAAGITCNGIVAEVCDRRYKPPCMGFILRLRQQRS